MKILFWIFQSASIAIVLFLVSCSPSNDYTKEIALLDSASLQLKAAESAIALLDTSALKTTFTFASNRLHVVSEKIANDTLSGVAAVFLNDAFAHTKNIGNLLDNKKFLNKALSEGIKRIDNLKHDLGKDLIEKKLSEEYIKAELTSADKLNSLISASLTKAGSSALKLDSLKHRLTSLTDSLSAK